MASGGGIEVGKYIDYAWHGYVSEEEEVQIINPWESGQSYSKYIRKPIAGLAPEYYGNVNIPRYPGSASQLGDDTSKKLIKWREEERDNNHISCSEMTLPPMNRTNMKVLSLG